MVVAESAPPLISHVPDYYATRGQEAIDLCEQLGFSLDDHQKLVLMHGCAIKKDGTWAFFEVGLCEPRQNGKGVILEAREIAGLFLWDEELLIHTAHQFDTSQEHFTRILGLIEDSHLESEIKTVRRSHGDEGIILRNGGRLRFRARTKGGGRGFSCDTLGLDEAMILPEVAMGALLPTMRARPNPQVWYAGSAVDQLVHDHGVTFARVRERALKGEDTHLCYFEWSLADENGDPYESPDEIPLEQLGALESWRTTNPAYGARVRREHFERELESLDNRTFAVEILGVGDWPRTDGVRSNPIKPEEWDLLVDETSVLQDPLCLAYDISPERRTSIAAAGRNGEGKWHVELVASWPGTAKLVEKMVELRELHNPFEIVADGYGPSASMVRDLLDAGVEVRMLNSSEHGQACGLMADAVVNRNLRHLGSQALTNAIRGAATRPLGDAWAWSRRNSSVDISPLVAMTLALSAAMGMPDDNSGVMIW